MTDGERSIEDAQPVMVRWNSGGQYTRWHVLVPLVHDTENQTACGIRYPRKSGDTAGMAYVSPHLICENCIRAIAVDPESEGDDADA